MSNLSVKTERKALKALAKSLRFFAELAQLDMTAADAQQAGSAQNYIRSILETNGYHAVYERGKGTRLMKQAGDYEQMNTKN
ncbi:hypothetical protein SAMN05421821_101347 [Mucilaginibacter lappiensis]|uniref:Uncharacterized protein n=1 Tax=Mucilaginibacter lappiensis TaxID=354630 RepID=A0ABR6PDC4_9SPHI|nr:hypothetical protein [Mucilaginibacter lappiensis]MBB6107737.1 hypothetical protein [Mucilaginibacter lappiensis]SIP98707.1 hypothetical protein SAMN05421821_101347 [Mucilaginibacter lappiensis]